MSTAYDFSTTGPGTFTFDPVPWFRVVGLNGTAKTHVADTHSVFITVTDGVSKREVDLEKRTLVFCKDAKKSDLLATNLADSKDLILVVMAYLITYDSDDTLYKDYFGLNPVRSVFDNFSYIYSERSISTILACEGSSDHCLGGIWSYTLDGKTLQFCPSFFAAPTYPPNQLCKDPNLGENSVSGGYVVTQLAKTFLFAEEIKAGCSDSQKLRDGEKLKNAANYKVRLVPLVVYLRSRTNLGTFTVLCFADLPESRVRREWIRGSRRGGSKVVDAHGQPYSILLSLGRDFERFLCQNRTRTTKSGGIWKVRNEEAPFDSSCVINIRTLRNPGYEAFWIGLGLAKVRKKEIITVRTGVQLP